MAIAAGVAAAFAAMDASAAVISYSNGQNNAGGINLTDNTTQLSVSGSDSAEQSGVISETAGPWGLEKIGTGTLTLSGINTYSGATTITGGTLAITDDANLGTGDLIFDGGTLRTDADITSNKAVTVGAANGTFDVNGHNSTLSGVIDGTGNLSILTSGGVGTLTLTAANTYSGGTTIYNNAVLAISNDNQMGDASGSITSQAGTLHALDDITSARNFNISTIGFSTNGHVMTLSGALSGSGTTYLTGGGTVALSHDNSGYSGSYHFENDTILAISNANNIGDSSATLDFHFGALKTLAAITDAHDIGITGHAIIDTNGHDSTLSGAITGDGGLIKDGAGSLALSGNNSYTGATTVNAGTLKAGSTTGLSSASAFTLDSTGTLDLNGFNSTIGSLAGSGTVTNNGGAAARLTAGGDNSGTIFSGLIEDGTNPLELWVTGSGVLKLTGTNTYTGGTVILGTVAITDDLNLGTSTFAFNGGTLRTDAAMINHTNMFLVGDGGTIDTNGFNSTFAGQFASTGSLTKTGEGKLRLAQTNIHSGGTIVEQGILEILNADNLGSGDLTLENGAILTTHNDITSSVNVHLVNGGYLQTQDTNNTWNGIISGTGGLTVGGGGTTTLTGINTYTGGTTIHGFQLIISDDRNLGGSGSIIFSDGKLKVDADITSARTVTVSGDGTLDTNGHDVTLSGTMNGSGAFSKDGAGTLTLSGATGDFLGSTTIHAGTLRSGAEQAFAYWSNLSVSSGAIVDVNDHTNHVHNLTGSGTVTNNGTGEGTLWVGSNSSNDFTFDGTLRDGSGVLSVFSWGDGNFTLTNTNNNTYSGQTFIAYGTLRGGAVNAFSPHSIVTLSAGDTAGAIDLNGYNQTIAGLNGEGTVTNEGSADATLTNDGNGYTFYQGLIKDGSTHRLALVKSGTGTLVLSGVNTYSGGTTISGGGTLTVENEGGLGSGDVTFNGGSLSILNAMNIANSVVLAGDGTIVNNGTNVSFSGVMSGAHTLVFENLAAATTTLNGVNTLGGQTLLHNGTLVLGNAQALGTSILRIQNSPGTLRLNAPMNLGNDILAEDNFTVDTSDFDSTLSGAIGGTGAFNKAGYGKLTLNGLNNYTGETTVEYNTLSIGDADHPSASITSNVLVGNFGTLSGHGTITGNVVNHGTVMPGGSIGTLHIAGDYTQSSSAALAIEVSPEAASRLAVTGTAALNGTLNIFFNTGTYAPKTYTVLTAGAITGRFSTLEVTAPAGFALGTVNYGTTSLSFDLSPAVPTSAASFSSVSVTGIANAHHAGDTIFGHLDDAQDGAQTQGSDLTFASLADKNMQLAENAADVKQLAKAMPQVMKQYGGWFKGTGNFASVESSASASGFESETGGFMFGVDRAVDKTLRLGAAGGYEHTGFTATNSADTKGESNAMRFTLYGSKALEDNLSLDGQIGYALHMIDANRFEVNNGTMASSAHDAHEFSSGFQITKKMDVDGVTLKPKAGLNYVHLAEDGYTETGAGIFNASLKDTDTDSLRLFIGLGVSKPVTRNGATFVPEAHIKYSLEALDSAGTASGTILGTGFTSKGVTPTRHRLSVGFSASAKINDTLDAFGSCDINLPTGNVFEETFAAGMKIRF